MTLDGQVPDRLAYSIPEVGRLLGVSESTVKRLLASGRLQAVYVGSQRRVPRSELTRLLLTADRAQQEAR